jgi:hypothetical protein
VGWPNRNGSFNVEVYALDTHFQLRLRERITFKRPAPVGLFFLAILQKAANLLRLFDSPKLNNVLQGGSMCDEPFTEPTEALEY